MIDAIVVKRLLENEGRQARREHGCSPLPYDSPSCLLPSSLLVREPVQRRMFHSDRPPLERLPRNPPDIQAKSGDSAGSSDVFGSINDLHPRIMEPGS